MVALLRDGSLPQPPMTDRGEDMRVLARGASALLAWLCVVVQARGQALGVDRVLYMTREGMLFKAYHERFAPSAGLTLQAELLRVSRLSTFAASLHGQGAPGLQRLFSQYPQAGWPELLASLGQPPDAGPAPLAGTGPALAEAIAAAPAHAAWMAGVAASRHAELAAYLRAAHAQALRAGQVLVVDIGWRGSIQDNLALAFPELRWTGVYVGLHPFLNPQPANAQKQGLLFDAADAQRRPGENLMPIEYLFHQSIGTVCGYRDGQAQTLASASAEDAFSAAFQAAVLEDAPARAAAWAREPGGATLVAWREQAQAFWEGCQRLPLPLFQALCRYAHEETFGLGQSVHLAEVMSPRAALRGLVSRRDRALFVQYIGALPLSLRHEPALGPWLRGWLHLRHVLTRLRSGAQH